MRQQAAEASSSHQANMQMVLVDQPSEPKDVPPRSQSSVLPPEFAFIDDYLAHLSQKYGLKRTTHPRVVIATPVPSPSAPTAASSPSDPTPSSTFIQGRIKRTARKRVPPPPRASVLNVSEDESMPHQEEEQAGSSSQTPSLFESAQKAAEAIPPKVEVKVEVDEMTQEKFEYFGTTNLTFSQAQMLDAMRQTLGLEKER